MFSFQEGFYLSPFKSELNKDQKLFVINLPLSEAATGNPVSNTGCLTWAWCSTIRYPFPAFQKFNTHLANTLHKIQGSCHPCITRERGGVRHPWLAAFDWEWQPVDGPPSPVTRRAIFAFCVLCGSFAVLSPPQASVSFARKITARLMKGGIKYASSSQRLQDA